LSSAREFYPSKWLAYAEKYVEVTKALGLQHRPCLQPKLLRNRKRLEVTGWIQIVPEIKTQGADRSFVT
jgi:hypothetical protein